MSEPISEPERRGKRYHGAHDLGRDDPLWPYYVRDAEKWDSETMNDWQRFLIEASKELRLDTSEINTMVLIDIARTLRALKNESESIAQGPLPTLENDGPSRTEVFVNMLWFLSLCLSIIVALITSLVKQWCNGYMSAPIAPPCNQARIRQARFNQLNKLKAGWIVSMLPVLMHVALALFLIGLIVFLKELNGRICIAALTVTALAAAVYLFMTLAPCFIPFCPYSTPLSSPKLWGYLQWLPAAVSYSYQFFFGTKPLWSDFVIQSSWCEQQEHDISNNTTPDEITGNALNWIILHTPDPETRDMAIRSISSLKSETTFKQLVIDPPGILPQVIQSFTSCFPVRTLPRESNEPRTEINIDTAALHARALLVLVNKIMRSSQAEGAPSVLAWSRGVDNETVVAVEKRFHFLAEDSNTSVKIVGMTGLSAWRRFTYHTSRSLDDRSELLVTLTQHLDWDLQPDPCSEILDAILVESTHWTPKIHGEQRTQLISRLATLVCDPNPNISDKLRAKLICSFAMLMLGLNHGQTKLRLPHRPGQLESDIETCITYDHAQSIVEYYIQNPSSMLADEPSLLLLALAGLMEYYEHRIFDEPSSDNIAKIVPLLLKLDIFGRFQSATLPTTVWLSVDPREYFVEVLAHYFQHAPHDLRPPTNTTIDTEAPIAKAPTSQLGKGQQKEVTLPPRIHTIIHLLQALVNHKSFWKDPAYVHALRTPILHAWLCVWSRTEDPAIRTVCLKVITSNLERTHLRLYVNMLFAFGIPYKLVELMHDQGVTQFRTPMAAIFGLLSEGATEGQRLGDEQDKSLGLVTRLLSDGLLDSFVEYILSSNPDEYNDYGKYWAGVIMEAVGKRLDGHRADGKLQVVYDYLKKRESSMRVPSQQREGEATELASRLLDLMDSKNEELKKRYKGSRLLADTVARVINAREQQSHRSSPGAGPSSAPGT